MAPSQTKVCATFLCATFRLRQCLDLGPTTSPSLGGRGPPPIFRTRDQTSFDRIILYVSNNAKELVLVAWPMIKRFLLPEVLTGTSKYTVSFSGSVSL